MPGRPRDKARRARGQEQTPRIRPLEALLRRGDRQGYDDAISIIAKEGPSVHQVGGSIQHGRWNGNGEWTEEKFRITPETLEAVGERLGTLIAVDVEDASAMAEALIRTAPAEGRRPGRERNGSGPALEDLTDQPREDEAAAGIRRQVEMMGELRRRMVAVAMLMSMPDLEENPRIRAESIALQMSRGLDIVWSSPRRPARPEGENGWLDGLREMTGMTRMVARERETGEEVLRDYLDRMMGWLEHLWLNLSEHVVVSGSAGLLLVRIPPERGEITCEPTADWPPGSVSCIWPECMAPDPRKCRHTGRSWRDCQLASGGPEQERLKYFTAKHEDLFPWPPEWEEEIRKMKETD